MISYELAKKLKNVGFPNSKDWLDEGDNFQDDFGYAGRVVPNLSQLIEACGDDFAALTKNRGQWDEFDKAKWWADGVDNEVRRITPGKGSTPEEAVANLWLALNKKS